MTKKCTKCGETKELSEFGRDKRHRDGAQSRCKVCERERGREKSLREYSSNPEKFRQRWRNRYHSDIAKSRKRVRDQYWRNPEESRRRASQRAAVKKIIRRGTLTEWDLKLSAQWRKVISKMPCYYCGTTDAEKYHVDHRIPVSKGGDDSWVNLVRACEPCNLSKSAKTDTEFFGWSR